MNTDPGTIDTRVVRLEVALATMGETQKDDHKRLRSIEDAVTRMEGTLASIVEKLDAHDGRVERMDTRLIALEQWRANITGRIAMAVIVLGLVGALAMKVADALLKGM